MSGYLERDALIEATENVPFKTSHGLTKEQCDGANFARLKLAAIFKALPTADVAPMRRGWWIYDGIVYGCSECGYNAYGNYNECLDGTFRYCPYCGAKMMNGGNK